MTPVCFMPTCDRKRDPKWALCRPCFTMLPVDLRMNVSRSYSDRMTKDEPTTGMRHAINAAHAWVLKTFGDESAGRESYTPAKWERLKEHVRARDAARAARRAELAQADKRPAGKPPHLKLVP